MDEASPQPTTLESYRSSLRAASVGMGKRRMLYTLFQAEYFRRMRRSQCSMRLLMVQHCWRHSSMARGSSSERDSARGKAILRVQQTQDSKTFRNKLNSYVLQPENLACFGSETMWFLCKGCSARQLPQLLHRAPFMGFESARRTACPTW